MTELSFHGIHTLRKKAESVTHVSGTGCHLCLGSLMQGRSLKVKGVSGCAQIRNANPFEKRSRRLWRGPIEFGPSPL